MINKFSQFSILFVVTLVFAAAAFAQSATPSGVVKNNVVTGEVISINGENAVIKTADGELSLALAASTDYKRVPPENPVLKAAVPATLADIGAGDKLLVSGRLSDDKKTLAAKSVYLMTKADLAQRPAKDLERWTTRGISGKVKSVSPDTKQIAVDISSMAGTRTVTITPKDGATYKRYAANSIKYSEATASNLLEINPGDGIRAVGDRSADGASFAAEEILSGGFQTHAGTVKSVDTAKNEVVITELQSKKDVTVSLGSASVMKKFPEQMAQMMAARQAGGGAGGPGPGGQPGAGQGQGRPMGGGMGSGGPRGGGIDEMLERFPNITAADLKVGDMIAVSSTKTATLDRITAIKLLAGVEPFVRMAQASASGGQGRGQGSQSLSIPGLDGFDMN